MRNEGPKTLKPQEFANSVGQSDAYELAAAQTALAQSRNPQVRAFAERMIADHGHLERALRAATNASGLEPPRPQVGGDQSSFLAALQSLRGDEFDREYGRQQMLSHISALTVLRTYAEKGSDPNLRSMAAFAMPMIERHWQSAHQFAQSIA